MPPGLPADRQNPWAHSRGPGIVAHRSDEPASGVRSLGQFGPPAISPIREECAMGWSASLARRLDLDIPVTLGFPPQRGHGLEEEGGSPWPGLIFIVRQPGPDRFPGPASSA